MSTIGLAGPMSPWMTGGIAVHVAELARALTGRHRVKAVTPGPASGRHRAGAVDVAVAREFPVRPLPPFESFPEFSRLLGHLRDADLVHVHDPRLFLGGPLLGHPLVTTFHGYLPLEAMANTGTKPGRPLYEFYSSVVRHAVASSREVIAVDSRIASWLQHTCGGRKATVIPNGVDPETFRPGRSGAALRAEWGIPPESALVVAAKHFVPKNGLEILVRAMPDILVELPSARLVLLGQGDLEGMYRRIVHELRLEASVAIRPGLPHDAMPDALAACDVCAVPSVPIHGVEEATSVLALEAMASAKPVVASNVGGLREILRDGETGRLVTPADPSALAAAVVEVLRDRSLAERLGRDARRAVVARHSWTAIAEQTETVYRRALASGSR